MQSQRDKDIIHALPLCGHDEAKAAIYADGMQAGRVEVAKRLFALLNSPRGMAGGQGHRAGFELWAMIRDLVHELGGITPPRSP